MNDLLFRAKQVKYGSKLWECTYLELSFVHFARKGLFDRESPDGALWELVSTFMYKQNVIG